MKRGVCILLVLLMLLGCTGCIPVQLTLDYLVGNEKIAAVEALPHFGFSNGDVLETTTILTAEELFAESLEYDDYRVSLFYDQLSDNEQKIYRAYEYALEHAYTNVLIDTSLVEDADHLYTILEYLSLDTPLLEQNLRYEMGTFTTYYPVQIYDFYATDACFEGYYLTIHNFESSLWGKKQDALRKAEEILASLSLSEDMSAVEKAECIYRYIGDTVAYEDYDEAKESEDDLAVFPYLYDALILGKTHCDGYANALSLLLNMAGIPCAEKQYTKEETDETGHTWAYANLGDVWTNIDGTYVEWIPDRDCSMDAGPGFGFSDIFQQESPDYAAFYSNTAQDLVMAPDAHLSSPAGDAFVTEAVNAYAEHNYEWAYILVDTYDEDALDEQMQRIANSLYTRICYASFYLMDDRAAILIYSGDLYNV